MAYPSARADAKTDFIQLLHGIGLKATPARSRVLAVLQRSDKPLSIEKIIALIGKSSMDQATIYRFLHKLADAGIVRRVDLHHDHAHYELASRADHHHLICEKCDAVEDISDCGLVALEAKIQKQKHFLVQQHALEFFGICARCSK